MWSRMKRVFRSFFGWFVELGEDPELILKQNIRDLEDQIPELNEQIALVKAQEVRQRKETEKLQKEEEELTGKIKAALRQGNRELALNFAQSLDEVKSRRKEAEGDLKLAIAAYEKALKVKKVVLAEKERKVAEARNALNAKKKAEWQSKVADVMTNFSATGVDATHDEMIRKIEHDAAHSEAKLEIALDGVDTSEYALDQGAREVRANETLRQLELEMGIGEAAGDISAPPEAAPQEKTIGPRERELA